MLVLIATHDHQGSAPGDYAHTVDGELVTPWATECSSGDRCGCSRGFPGLASGKATTTAMVVERPGVDENDLRQAVYDWLDRGGWFDLLEQTARDRSDPDIECGLACEVEMVAEALIDEHLELIERICAAYPAGTVIGRHGSLVLPRTAPTAA